MPAGAAEPNSNNYNITILSSSNSELYQSVIDTIIATANTDSNKPISFSTIYAKEEYELRQKIATIDKIDLLVTIGQLATSLAAELDAPPPILATLLTSRGYKDIIHDISQRPSQKSTPISAIYLDNPIDRQLQLAKLILGKSSRIGLLLYADSIDQADEILARAKQIKLRVSIGKVDNTRNIIHTLSEILEQSDALIATPDIRIFNRKNARNILLTLYRHRAPLIAFSASYVKAGALASVYSTPQQLARQTGKAIKRALSNGLKLSTEDAYPVEFEVVTNKNVAKSLGIVLPPDNKLKRAILRIEGHSK
jgi:ABC-type uncharacterized transport system substrate-binding protein